MHIHALPPNKISQYAAFGMSLSRFCCDGHEFERIHVPDYTPLFAFLLIGNPHIRLPNTPYCSARLFS